MRRFAAGVVLVALGFATRPGQAKVEFEVGARLGYAVASGKLADEPVPPNTGDDQLKTFVKGEVPLALELGVRPIPMLTLGGYLELAPGILGSGSSALCDALHHDCTAVGFSFGVMAYLHALPHQGVDPWFGAGIGFGILGVGEEVTSDQTVTLAYGGVEFPLRAGVDFKLSERFYLGPYVGYTLGTFSGRSLSCSGPDCSENESDDIDDTARHGWFGFGAKLTIVAF